MFSGFTFCLRPTSSAVKNLVDVGSGSAWKNACQEILSVDTIPDHEDGFAAQKRLQIHAAALHRLKAGESLLDRQ